MPAADAAAEEDRASGSTENGEPIKTRHPQARLWIEAAVGVVLLAVIVVLVWYLRSPQFGDFVRRKVIDSIEDATGGRVDMGSFHWNLAKLQFEAGDLTIHGLERPDQLPYVHVDRMQLAGAHLSFVQTRISLEYLGLEHPVIHLIVHPDGTTNAPEPRVKQSNSAAAQQLLDLAVARVDLRNGMLLVNERRAAAGLRRRRCRRHHDLQPPRSPI